MIALTALPDLFADAITGDLVANIQSGSKVDSTTIHFYTATLSYINGGLTFAFPENYFSSAPYVYVTTALNQYQYTSDLEVNPIIVANNEDGVTIRINRENTGLLINGIVEAASDDFFVSILAIGS